MKGLETGTTIINGLLRKRLRAFSVGGRFEESLTCTSRWFPEAPQVVEPCSCVGTRKGFFLSLTQGFEVNSGRGLENDEGERAIGQLERKLAGRHRLGNDWVFTSPIRLQIPSALLQSRNYRLQPLTDGGRWMRVSGAYAGPLSLSPPRDPFRDGSVRFKSRKKQKKAKQKKREVLSKIKRIRVASKKRKEDMTPEELLEFRIQKGKRKVELIDEQIAKFPVQELPPVDPDIEVLTPEQLHYLKKIGYKNKNYVPVGRRGVYGGTIQNIHLHWKKHETVQVEIAGFSREEVKVMADQLARLSGGLVVDIHQGNIVILYRGRNYKQPKELIPMKTLDKRKALMKSKLEQSRKAILANQEKLEKELKQLRRDIAQGFAVGSPSGDAAKAVAEVPPRRNLGPADRDALQDPDSYGSMSEEDDDIVDYLSEEESLSDMSDWTSQVTSDSDEEEEVDDGEETEEEDSDPEDLGRPATTSGTVRFRK